MKNNIITTRIAQNRSKALQSIAKKAKPKPKVTESESGNYTDASGALLTGNISAEGIFVPGQEVERLAQPGTPEYDRWKAAVEADPSIEDKYKDRLEITSQSDVKPQLTKEQAGTRSDVYRTMEERRYGAGGRMDAIRLRKEKKYGRRQLKQLEKYFKSKGPDYVKTKEDIKKEQAFKDMKMGQGPAAQEMYKRMTDPNTVSVQQEQQRLRKTPRLSTYTENLQDIEKKQEGGQTIMAPEGTETIDAAKARLEGKVGGKLNLGNKNYSNEFKKVGESLSNMPAFARGISKNPSAYKSGKIKAASFKMGGYGSKSYNK